MTRLGFGNILQGVIDTTLQELHLYKGAVVVKSFQLYKNAGYERE